MAISMEIMTLNLDFEPIGLTNLPYLDMVWDRKYYETGKFSVQILAENYNSEMQYIYTKERPELGMIQQTAYSEKDETVTLSGFFYEKRLADKIVYPMFEQYGTREEFVAAVVERYKSDIPKLTIAAGQSTGEKIRKQETGATLEETAYSTLQVEGKSFRCIYRFERDEIEFQIYQGIDRTQAQSVNNFVTFSKGFRNIQNVKAQNDSSAYKNYFVVGGQGEGADRIIAVLDLSGGGYRRELFIDGGTKTYNPAEQSAEEYKSVLVQMAVERAQRYVNISNVEFDTVADAGAKYLEDYDLGDKCDIILDRVGMSFEARIIEILETWSGGEHQVTLTFGDKIPTLYERARVR
ncbi:MAG: siphovirus ReqiPepy6 Gp37-like family protein [Roseburia sp.]|nr:siphovirus ReqiPepy6 Gp37-like family protein [Roseburia sp.]MCM1097784.1 siphovirus ReqiPepy6 Gp37-like family protein [Ruminococcus flavefaciens]